MAFYYIFFIISNTYVSIFNTIVFSIFSCSLLADNLRIILRCCPELLCKLSCEITHIVIPRSGSNLCNILITRLEKYRRIFQSLIQYIPMDRYAIHIIEHFTERMDTIMADAYPHTRLRNRRINSGFSQSELATASGVALRQIQLFEQRQRNINNASAITLLQLSKPLHCRMEDLIEY